MPRLSAAEGIELAAEEELDDKTEDAAKLDDARLELEELTLELEEIKLLELAEDASELDASELDASELDASELDASELDASELETTELEVTGLEIRELEATELELTELIAVELATTLLATALDTLFTLLAVVAFCEPPEPQPFNKHIKKLKQNMPKILLVIIFSFNELSAISDRSSLSYLMVLTLAKGKGLAQYCRAISRPKN